MRPSYMHLLAAAFALLPAASPAQEAGYDCRALDLNGDRLIQRSEWNRVANADRSAASGASAASGGSAAAAEGPAFRRADRNHSGYLSERELWTVPARKGGGWIAVDENRDGRISPSEFRPLSR